MDLFELGGGNEDHPVYQQVSASNSIRHYDFLHSMILAAIAIGRPLLSQFMIKAINFHAIAGLHHEAGEYRSHAVAVGNHQPPLHYRVGPLMDDFVNVVNWRWQSSDATELAAYALWRINYVHPFVNGNGRTARAVCDFTLCVKSGGLLPGSTILPEMLRTDPVRGMYVNSLQEADKDNLDPLIALIRTLITKQVSRS